SINAGWNIISDPVVTFNHWYKSLFPSAISKAFQYSTSYQIVDSLVPGKGYWIKFLSSMNETITGDSMPTVTMTVDSGWNMIGSVDHIVSAPSGGMVISKTFAYKGSYQIVSTLNPGQGYWIKTNKSGLLTLGPQALPRTTTNPLDSYTEITIADKLGRKQKLYLAPSTDSRINPDVYSMPPIPPGDAFDIRFVSQRMLEVIPQDIQDAAVFPVQMQSAAYPITVTYAIKNSGGKQVILDEQQSGTQQHHVLKGEGSLTISAGNENTLSMRVTNGKEIPLSFALKQNFPNPFNPTTKIAFDVPVASRVTIKVYDIIGREIMTPANGFFEAGSYMVSMDFNTLASGIYFYRLTAGDFTDVKKMVVTK
ncbi:MAG TPA: T9SS type A sorting domain-containing protein, partial [Bacteroidota bacterium]|nr:T9SS type A sorting domain-containing protein [Bacteroidota bacterium]